MVLPCLRERTSNALRAGLDREGMCMSAVLQELVEAKSQYDALVHVKRGLEQQKTEMEAKLANAAGALHAADELKELRFARCCKLKVQQLIYLLWCKPS